MIQRPPILDHVRWQALSARLDDLAAARTDLAAACAAIRAPIDTIDRLWRDALPALRGDVLAVERLAVLTGAAIPAAALVKTAHTAAELARKTKLSEDHQPGLLRIGEIAVLATAAARVAPAGLVSMYAATVHGLALQAAPAEILAHLEPYGPPLDTLGDLVARLVPPRAANGAADRLVLERFIYNRFELGRWRCLDLAFAALGFEGKVQRGDTSIQSFADWSPATTDKIHAVTTSGAGAIAISGVFAWRDLDRPVVLGATAIIDGDGVPSVAVEVGAITALDNSGIAARFPQPVEWVGYALPSGVERARALRERVRERIAEIASQPCVADSQLPALIVDVPPLTAMTEAPPRRSENRVAGAPTVAAWVRPATLVSGKTVTFAWQSDGVDVQITASDGSMSTAPATGTRTYTLANLGTAVFSIIARDGVLASPSRSVAVTVTPADTTGDGEGEGEGEGSTEVLTFVVFRPHVLDSDGTARQVTLDGAQAAVDRAAALFDAEAVIVELPWAEDGLAVLASSPHGCDDPGVIRLLEELDRAAARTPSREDAIWLAIVPDDPVDTTLSRAGQPRQVVLGLARPAEAALAVAVANPDGVAPAIAELAKALSGNSVVMPTPAIAHRALISTTGSATGCSGARGAVGRMRIIGELENRTVRLIDAPRLDKQRAAGPGAPVQLGLSAVCCDARGRELGRTPIGGHRGDQAAFVALVPVTDDVSRIELRFGDQTAMRIERPSSPLQLAPVVHDVDAERMSIRWSLAAGSALEVILEAATSKPDNVPQRDWVPAWVPITALSGCRNRHFAPAWRMPPNIVIRVIATDGWNVAEQEKPILVGDDVRSGPFVIRQATDRMLWAELPESEGPPTPIWHLPQGAVATGRIVTLPATTRGDIELGADGIADIIDSFTIGSLDGERRN